ncbi:MULTISPECIES: class I SAM-dependent methyltransferase [unclassified Novosphingobium]|uniref:class I SAM-dependent methyltransferase n=1 Tax=unclassified Novosphingobium TaxID=2644732 RepID=UPI00149449D9|nr:MULTISPECIES: class I SAM-dependent methyltransferase [unclassified Novosphingobium]MBB3356964.1 ubiquinone/menaquinone biosynthesis C-methylase UbiE [Novosphingobium sp. BK256]MBB3373365.1 ubiquinone/menaquinone biosynthesis C-methylase UbiE [Novosphingobium sp. BK280]MBB3377734.1 ubiquinone/menaquinone biosynthesis C-methylase UbiE [Novosphingobium sp. BK258]MBB3418855.1 ubiquinone/menaquinone biosynthesis C-methylase UbiE [Novosphingobium sp. BK267]MBB3450310.1 ubiquinone/menaquinone bio
MTRSHETVVEAQFGSQAKAYVTSIVHARGEDLDAVEAIARREAASRALDLGTGGGHVAYRLSPHSGTVTAVDLSAAMLEAIQATARQQGLSNVEICNSPAEQLPFEDASFDLLATRFSAHHWRDWNAGLREARRVLKPGATAIFIDVISPGHAPFDTHLQAVELLRDPSHVRDHTESEWAAALDRAGFRVRSTVKRRLRMEFTSWVERMRTPDALRTAIRALQQLASAETAAYFAIEPDGSFSIDALQVEASACRARTL